MTPACYVVTPAEVSQILDALGNAFLLVVLLVWAAGVDWWRWEWRYRMWRRRRRLRGIRARRVAA